MNYKDIIGTIGVGLILIAYFLNIFSLIKKDGKLYFIMNIIALLINYMPFIILEGTWAIVVYSEL